MIHRSQNYTNSSVHIRTENTNDEAPVFFPTRHYTAYVAEDAQGGTPVVQIQARDPDRDQVEYAFVDKDGMESYETSLFHIDKDTGLIKLRPGVQAADLLRNDSPYNLTVIARDDGSCCSKESPRHTALATVLIGIEDVNNNRPEFRDCASYGELAKIQEGVYKKNPPVIIKASFTTLELSRW
ncbi:cadherin domain protein [Teladorsagia circumcincta]|uniref:Cadherin domain protein n=1 Tax=Teladorsagia circumcincta TaxID=45464 RepID=A0A2G9TX43_TELCI|nr:cadherin domain protein [Teladorsagia circumcincta]